MTRIHRGPRAAALAALLGLSALSCLAAGPADETAIRQLILATWDKPQAPVEVGPVVVTGAHAVAGWTQGPRGGRALMSRDKAGNWSVAACGGDGLKDAKVLASAGLSEAQARQLSAALEQAERSLPPTRKKLFSSFDGLVRMDGGTASPHAAHAEHAEHAGHSQASGPNPQGAQP